MDESITPLLYRVNGLYNEHGISSVLVVGGVGDWLDVPDSVIRLEKYVASDAYDKAKSSKCSTFALMKNIIMDVYLKRVSPLQLVVNFRMDMSNTEDEVLCID